MGRFETLDEMLRSNGSREFNDFVENLGWRIELQSHQGYFGNLNPELGGPYSRYFSDFNTEIMFHVSTLMPNLKDNRHKLNYIMNDPILIVWNEYYEENSFKSLNTLAKTIIQITPLNSGLIRIIIQSEDGILGPLINNCIVTKFALPTFVLQTAKSFITYNTPSYPLEKRSIIITRMLEKYGREISYNDMYSNLFKYE